MERVRQGLFGLLANLAALLLLLLLAAVLTGVAGRELGIGIVWVEETSRFLLEWLGYVGLVAVVASGGLMTAWRPNSPAIWRARSLVEGGLLALVAIAGFRHLGQLSGVRSPSLDLPEVSVFAVVPVALAFLTVLWVANEWRGGSRL